MMSFMPLSTARTNLRTISGFSLMTLSLAKIAWAMPGK